MQFEIPVEEARGKRSYVISLHLIVCFLLLVTGIFEFLLYVFFAKAAADKFQYFHLLKWGGPLTTLSGLVLLGFLIFKNKWLNDPAINRTVRILELVLFAGFALAAWRLEVPYPAAIFAVVAACLFFAIFWETKQQDRKVIVSEEGVSTPKASGNQLLRWFEIEQVIYRFGIITIDCVDNRLLQWAAKPATLDEELFTEFCRARIAAGIKDRGKNW